MIYENITDNDIKRFWDKVEIRGDDDCWYWKSKAVVSWYGHMNIRDTHILAHRLSFQLSGRNLPDGLKVLHSQKCTENAIKHFGDGRKSRLCCNPKHLRAGTMKENSRDTVETGMAKGLFKKGHISSFGESHANCKLSSKDIENIRKDNRSQYKIAKDYKINPAYVWQIKNMLRRKLG